MIFTTEHGADRLRKRLGVEKKRVDHRALEALDKGLPAGECTGHLRRYLNHQASVYGQSGRKAIVWQNALWIFTADDSLITCFPLPGHLNKGAQVQIEKWRRYKY